MIEWVAIGTASVAFLGLLGSIIHVYSSINSSLNENRQAIAENRKAIVALRQEMANLERRTADETHEMRDSIRLLTVKLIERDKGGDE